MSYFFILFLFQSSSFEDSCRSSPTGMVDSLSQFHTIIPSPISRNIGYLEATGPPERTYKVLFAGDAAVGKTYFIHRFCKGFFANRLGSTVGNIQLWLFFATVYFIHHQNSHRVIFYAL